MKNLILIIGLLFTTNALSMEKCSDSADRITSVWIDQGYEFVGTTNIPGGFVFKFVKEGKFNIIIYALPKLAGIEAIAASTAKCVDPAKDKEDLIINVYVVEDAKPKLKKLNKTRKKKSNRTTNVD